MVHKHHRVLGDRSDNRPVNILVVDDEVHRWIHDNPAEAMELGWIVSKHDDPENISVCIPKAILEKPPKKPREKAAPKAPREKRRYLAAVPADEENLLPETIEAVRVHLAERMGWSSDVPDYFVLMAGLAAALQS